MKISVSCACWFFACCSGIILCGPFHLCAMPRDMDLEERMSIEKAAPEQAQPSMFQTDNGLMESTEVKYTAGKDMKWFTKDDDVYEYLSLYYDDKDRLVKKTGFWEGADGLLMTKDDVMHDYLVYEYGIDGKISREILYDGKGVLQYTGIYKYNDSGQKVSVKRFDPENKETGSTNFFYGHAGLIVQDVDYKGDQIEKYHRFLYDSKHRTGRVIEFLGSEGGKGADGLWFTDDDVVTSAKQCFYNKDGTKNKEKKYIEPGPDKKWFTKDDVLQYYTDFRYQKKTVKSKGAAK